MIQPLAFFKKNYIIYCMAKKCDACERGSRKGATRSHSNVKTIKRQNISLHTRKVIGGSVKLCTKCLKTANK